ncbi:MAG TPA: hypothetical protein VN496_17130 [Burkholderiales bacterium]|nr:hypothetical protein [Burkholderiales bacterium]
MMIVVRFQQGAQQLTVFTCPLPSPEKLHECVTAAFQLFYKEHPGLALLDGVIVKFDKAE